jgi:hypothetical protein
VPEKTKESSSRKVLCPECETETTVSRVEGEDEGKCEKCGLDVGRILTKRRYDRALAKMNADDEKEKKSSSKSKSEWW